MSWTIKNSYFDKYTITLWILFLIIAGCIFSVGMKETLDTKLYYTHQEATAFLTSLNPENLSSYAKIAKLDLAFILVYSLLFIVSLKKVCNSKMWIYILATGPGIFDLVETFNILNYLMNPTSNSVYSWLGYITFVKWISVLLVVLFFIISFLRQRRLQSSENQF